MDDPQLEPLDPGLEALFASEREAEAPTQALGAVWSRVATSIGSGPGGGTSGGGASGGGAGHGVVARVAGRALLFVAGGVVGAAIYAQARPAPERVVYVDRRASAPIPSPAPPAPSFVPIESAVTPAPSTAIAESAPSVRSSPRRAPAVASVATRVPVSPVPSSLSAERALLDAARSALADGDGPHALALTDEHQQRFPRPQLGEEREAVAIQALTIAGRYDEARARAARFRASSPNSLFQPAVEASLGSIP